MGGKLNLDFEKVGRARNYAHSIAQEVQSFIDRYTTVTVERTVCRLLGINGAGKDGVPLPNVVVENIAKGGGLSNGAAYYFGGAMAATKLSPARIAQEVDAGNLNLTDYRPNDPAEAESLVFHEAEKAMAIIRTRKQEREQYLAEYGDKDGPYLYVIVATGNIYEDITQATAAAKQGADIIAVIRSTGQSLLDYVPFGATTEGFGGTFATQENFRLMRAALDLTGAEQKRYIRLCNYCSGLCMPEIAAMGAVERLDVMLNDALYGILFRDINMQRTLIDQYFSRVINGFAGIIINTGEDNYLTTSDAFEEAHTVLASQFINEQFALFAGIPEEQMGLGHAFEMNPEFENAFVYELAQAQMTREIFSRAPLKYMPPTKYMSGDIFKGQVQDALFNMITIMTGQKVHLLGMLTEAIHTPFMSDRALAIENAEYVFRTMKSLGDEIHFKEDGMIQKRADYVLTEALDMLCGIQNDGLFSALERGAFADVKRARDGGRGLAGVTEKGVDYYNPFLTLMKKRDTGTGGAYQ